MRIGSIQIRLLCRTLASFSINVDRQRRNGVEIVIRGFRGLRPEPCSDLNMTFPTSNPRAGWPCIVGTTGTIFEIVRSRLIRTRDGLTRTTSAPNGACTF